MVIAQLVNRLGRTLTRITCALLVACAPALHAQAQHAGPADVLPLLTTVEQVHALPAEEARRHYPVRLRAVMTYYDPYIDKRHGAMFIQDATGGVFVSVPHEQVWPGGAPVAGSLVEVQGTTGPGDFASVALMSGIRILQTTEAFPAAQVVNVNTMLSGVEDCRWVVIEGIVQSVFESARNVTYQIKLPDGTTTATTVRRDGADYAHLVDAKVRFEGVIAPLFNADRQMTGARMFFPDLSKVTIVDPAPADAFLTKPRPIAGLSRFTAIGNLAHRVHVRGTVTLDWPGQLLCLQDQTQGICGQIAGSNEVRVGSEADMVGFVTLGNYRPTLVDAVYQSSGQPGAPEKPAVVNADTAMRGDFDSELVTIEGMLIGRDLAAGTPTLVLSSGNFIYSVALPASTQAARVNAIPVGARLRLTGLCSVQLDGAKSQRSAGTVVNSSFHILLRDSNGIQIVQMPSPWTAGRVLLLLVIVLFITAAVLIWVLILRRRVEQQTLQILDMAKHDALTGLPTRPLLHERLGAALAEATRKPAQLALLMLDLDNFKMINDSLGHQAGDEVLCAAAERMRNVVRNTDTIARIGGDEFIILLCDLTEDAEQVAARIVAALHQPMQIGTEELSISVSVGVYKILEPDVEVDVLLRNVDLAMYAAKANGRNGFEVFSSEMAGASLRLLKLRLGLAHALDRGELSLHYQPLIDFQTGALAGFEALARWTSPNLGLVSPGEFIPIAEESDLILAIGEWVLNQSCRDLAALEQQLGRTFSLSVNLSARQFLDANLATIVARVLKENHRAPSTLRVEITESTLVSDSQCAQDALNQLRVLGVQLAIDDFGIGFSTLSYITRFAVDWIKIDRSLICNCTTDLSRLAVLRAIVTMAHGLGIRVVAEGVELVEQFELLRREQCDLAQGFYLSRPVAVSDLVRMVISFEHARLIPQPSAVAPLYLQAPEPTLALTGHAQNQQQGLQQDQHGVHDHQTAA